RCGWSGPRRIVEIEELAHVYLRGVSGREVRQIEAGFDQLKDGSTIRNGMRDVSFARELRDDEHGNAEASTVKICRRLNVLLVLRHQVNGSDPIWLRGRLWRYVVERSS